MKKCILLLFIICISCSPKLRSTIDNSSRQALAKDALVVVMDVNNIEDIKSEKIGEVKIQDGGLGANCSYYENIQAFKSLAREAGANLIKITKHKTPDKWSTCHRIWADVYYVDNPKDYETQIIWQENRKLTWDDFKGEPDTETYPTALALTNSGFGFEPSVAGLFQDGNLFIQATMNTYKSWVIPEGRNEYVLRHEQIHFDITEIYSRKLRKIFQENNFTSADYQRAKEVFSAVFEECRLRQDDYDKDTQKGKKKETQEKWEAIVEIELLKYEAYKSN